MYKMLAKLIIKVMLSLFVVNHNQKVIHNWLLPKG